MSPPEKTMFEIYREGGGNRRARVIYFTELEEHERDREIERAASGRTLFAGFLRDDHKAAAKEEVARILEELGDGEGAELDEQAIARRLGPYLGSVG